VKVLTLEQAVRLCEQLQRHRRFGEWPLSLLKKRMRSVVLTIDSPSFALKRHGSVRDE
jgi:hypothetical protein